MNSVNPGKNLKVNIMQKKQIKTFQMWSKRNEYKSHIRTAERVITGALDDSNSYVAYSGGKDSLVLLHLVLQQNQDVDVWHWDYGDHLMPRYLEEEVIKNAEMMGTSNIIICKRKGGDARTNHATGYKQFFGTLNKLKKKHGWNLGFVGIRREESCNRKNKYTKFFMDDCCYPLLNLTWLDIWAYIVSNKLPYPSTYDSYSEVVGWDKSRFVTFFDEEFQHKNAIDGILMPEHRNMVRSI